MRGMSRENRPDQSHSKRGPSTKTGSSSKRRVRSSHEPSPEHASRELGQTSDEYQPDPNPLIEMTPGDELAMTNPDVQQIGPPGGAAYDRGFGDQSLRRDR